jgi:hypothetical protein
MLKETGFKYVIFSITGNSNVFKVIELNAAFATLGFKRPTHCCGAYKGQPEYSWITTTAALDALWESPFGASLLGEQESFLLFSECNKQYAELFYPDASNSPTGQQRVPMGSMVCVSREEALRAEAWTYRPDTRNFYVCRKENPDRECMADRQQRELWAAIDGVLDNGPMSLASDLARLRAARASMKPRWL